MFLLLMSVVIVGDSMLTSDSFRLLPDRVLRGVVSLVASLAPSEAFLFFDEGRVLISSLSIDDEIESLRFLASESC